MTMSLSVSYCHSSCQQEKSCILCP